MRGRINTRNNRRRGGEANACACSHGSGYGYGYGCGYGCECGGDRGWCDGGIGVESECVEGSGVDGGRVRGRGASMSVAMTCVELMNEIGDGEDVRHKSLIKVVPPFESRAVSSENWIFGSHTNVMEATRRSILTIMLLSSGIRC